MLTSNRDRNMETVGRETSMEVYLPIKTYLKYKIEYDES